MSLAYDNDKSIAILLALYNCEKYVAQQMDSIINQSIDDWQLYIRDDCSQVSEVRNIVNTFKYNLPHKIHTIDGDTNLGACQNFAYLTEICESKYYMYSDCDDVWLKDKIAITFSRMKDIEREYGSETPILVHTDLEVVDDTLELIHNSFWRYVNIRPEHWFSFNKLLVRNSVTGCTVMMNRALRDMMIPIPPEAVVHDWWAALVAAAFGVLSYVNVPTVLYRQHGKNDKGAQEWRFDRNLRILFDSKYVRERLVKKERQAQAFHERFSNKLGIDQNKALDVFCNIDDFGFLSKRINLFRYNLLEDNFQRNLGLFLYI